MDIPDQFLGKIAQQLSHAGLIEVVQGSKGGLRLVVSPEKISLLDVVEAVIGEIFLNDCLLKPDSCDRSNSCAAHFVWEKARNQLRDHEGPRPTFGNVEKGSELAVLALEVGRGTQVLVQSIALDLQLSNASRQIGPSLVPRVDGQERSENGGAQGSCQSENLWSIQARESPGGDQQGRHDRDVTALMFGSADVDVPQRLLR